MSTTKNQEVSDQAEIYLVADAVAQYPTSQRKGNARAVDRTKRPEQALWWYLRSHRTAAGLEGRSTARHGGGRRTWAKEYMRLVLRERGADHAWITMGTSASGADAILLLSPLVGLPALLE
jgi:hypothetical protein